MNDAMWTPTDLAYFAGIIDGEGCFCLHNYGSHRYASQLQIGSTDPRLMQWIVTRFGGSMNHESRRARHHKPIWRWVAHATNLDAIIAAVLPFLIIKKEQAEIMQAYRATLAPRAKRGPRSSGQGRSTAGTPEHVKHARLLLHSQLAALNRRGVAS